MNVRSLANLICFHVTHLLRRMFGEHYKTGGSSLLNCLCAPFTYILLWLYILLRILFLINIIQCCFSCSAELAIVTSCWQSKTNAEFQVLTAVAVKVVSGGTCLPKCTLSHLQKTLILTRQAMYIQRNTEAHLCNHCCSGRAMSFAYSVCAFVAFFIQHAPYCHL